MELLNQIPLIGPLLFWVLPFVVVLSIVVAIHELGHLMVGRMCGIKAEVYSVGFGKTLWSRVDKYGTRWQIAALPFGGFVKFLGDMDPASARQGDDSDIPVDLRKYAFHNAALWRRALTVLAGPVSNFVLSLAIFFGIALYVGKASPDPVIASIGELEQSEIGFAPGDRVISINGETVEDYGDVIRLVANSDGVAMPAVVLRDGEETEIIVLHALRPMITGTPVEGAAIAAGMRPGDILVDVHGTPVSTVESVSRAVANLPPGEEVTIKIEREGKQIDIAVTPDLRVRPHPETGVEAEIPFLGISMARGRGLEPTTESVSFSEAANAAVASVWRIISDTVVYIRRMLFDGADTSHLSGPIGIAKHSSGAAEQGLANYIHFIAFVSTAIGLLNLFPIPVLDGGHLVFYMIEAVRRKPANPRLVEYSSLLGLSLLLLLMVFVTINNDLGLGEWLTQD